MTRKSGTSIKVSLAALGILAVGLAAGSNLGRVAEALTPEAQAAGGQGHTCTQKSLKGKYGYSYDVNIYGLGDFDGIGSQTCDDDGNCTGTDTVVIFGQATTLPFTSSYTVNADCTGTGEIHFPGGIVLDSWFVLVDGGREIRFIGADADGQSAGVAKRR